MKKLLIFAAIYLLNSAYAADDLILLRDDKGQTYFKQKNPIVYDVALIQPGYNETFQAFSMIEPIGDTTVTIQGNVFKNPMLEGASSVRLHTANEHKLKLSAGVIDNKGVFHFFASDTRCQGFSFVTKQIKLGDQTIRNDEGCELSVSITQRYEYGGEIVMNEEQLQVHIEGQHAYREGLSLSDNPHTGFNYVLWERGWKWKKPTKLD